MKPPVPQSEDARLRSIRCMMERLSEHDAKDQLPYKNADEMMQAGRDAMAPLADLRSGGLVEHKRINIAAYVAFSVFLSMALAATAFGMLL